ncbi:MAG: MBL fold metallo-hydrolase [Haloplanus sp.]
MAIGDVSAVPGSTALHYVDIGLYGVPDYGSVYVLDAERPAVVDTGLGTHVDRVVDAIESVGIGRDELEYVLPTHVHLDHAGGAGFLVEEFPNATVLTHEIGVPHLRDPSRLVAGTKAAVGDRWRHYVEPRPVPEDRIEGLRGGDAVDLGDRTLDVMHAPGHAPHQICFHDDGDDALFTADAAGIWLSWRNEVLPTSPPADFDLERCLDDVDAIVARDPETLCYGHFGPVAFSTDLMATYKRVLTDWVDRVREKRAELGDDDAVVEYFVEHRETIDRWTERKTENETRLNVRGVLGYLDHAETN